jgi:hypothetical protein
MPILSKEDLQCFSCCLEDCKEKNKGCKRLQLIKETQEYKDKIFKTKMTSKLVLKAPIVVR